MDYNLQKYKRLNLSYQLFLLDLDPKFFTSLPLFYSETLRAWMKIGARIETPTNSINHILNLPIIYPPLVNPLPGGATFIARLWAGGTHFIKQLLNILTPASGFRLKTSIWSLPASVLFLFVFFNGISLACTTPYHLPSRNSSISTVFFNMSHHSKIFPLAPFLRAVSSSTRTQRCPHSHQNRFIFSSTRTSTTTLLRP